jgi:hypothetical protein
MTTLVADQKTPFLSPTGIGATLRGPIIESTFSLSPKIQIQTHWLSYSEASVGGSSRNPNGLASGSKSGGGEVVVIGASVGGSLAVIGVGIVVAIVRWRKRLEADEGDANGMLPQQLL